MARPLRTRRAANPAPRDESPAEGGPPPSTLRKRSHADALGHDTTSALSAAAGAAETSPRRSKRGKTGKEADADDEADSVRGAAPHAAAAAASRLDPCPSSSTLATSSDLGIEIAITERPDVDRPLGDDSDAVAAEDDEMTAQERRAFKGKAKATDEDEDQVMAENVASSEDAVQKRLRELNELVASQTAILASLHSAVTCNVCLERLERPFALQCGHVFRRPAESPEAAAIGTSEVAGPSSAARAPPPPPPVPPASVPTAEVAAATTTTATASTSRAAAAPASIPFPVRAPTGDHRMQNLVCPQCRASCAMRAPQRIFALDEVLSTLSRARVNEQGTRPRSASPVKLRMRKKGDDVDRGEGAGEGEIDPNLLDEKDKTWGGLFPGEGGTESSRDRRRRLAQVVRDREDGVRRCGHCNWELDERTGICEGCGREWDISSDDDSDSDSSGAGLLPFRRGFLGRQHHDLAHSSGSGSGSGSEDSGESDGGGSSARGERINFGYRPGGGSTEEDNDSYESDFVVKSEQDEDEDEDGGRPGANAIAASRWKAIRHPSTDDSSSSSSDDSEDEATIRAGRDRRHQQQRRRARSETGSSSSSSDDSVKWTRRRSPNADPSSSDEDDDAADESREKAKRKRRLQGEVIDPDSDSGSDSADDDGTDSGENSSGSSEEEEEEEEGEGEAPAPRTTRSGRRIAAPAGGRNIDVSGFDTSSGDDDYSAQDSRGSGGSGGSGITDDESSSSSSEDREAGKKGKGRPSPTKKKKKRAIAASSSDDD
ncbi:hypothetical protein B0A53_00454 [Rhodotorula sp. CCFEE 5036]|nr:hypothetical protein B0A53_00454 [Rhodotorula sp. CCFEE 5036]